jgi:hypothetical protein
MLKEASRGQRFHSDDEMKETVFFWLQQQAKSTGIQKLVKKFEKCIAKDGHYVEKQHLIWICIYDVHLNRSITQFALTY